MATTPAATKPSPTWNVIDDDTVFNHITVSVLKMQPKHIKTIQEALCTKRIHSFLDLIELLDADIDKNCEKLAKYKTTPNQKISEIDDRTIQKLKRISCWALEQECKYKTPLSTAEWMIFTRDDYNDRRTTTPSLNTTFGTPVSTTGRGPYVSPMQNTPHTPGSGTSSATSASFLDLSTFRKGTKRDATANEIFKDEHYFDAFWQVFKSTAKAQGFGNVLYFSYQPPVGDLHADQLFGEQKIFLYSVLIKIIQANQGRAFVCPHEQDEDACAVIKKRHDHHTKSELAKREILCLPKYLADLQ
ncbi:hypothetical protein ACA910_004452 [Epithemia clementina (nom. ined.)]